MQSCSNYFHSFEKRDQFPYKFHRFPSDIILCNTWRSRCGLRRNTDVKDLMVCSAHFYLDDYQRNYKEEFVNPNFKRELKSSALPSQNLITGSGGQVSESMLVDDTTNISEKQAPLTSEEIKKTVDLNEELQQKYKDLLQTVRTVKQKSHKLERNTQLFKKKLHQYRNNSVEIDDLQKVFSASQINLLLGRKKVYWTDDDLARAFTLRHIGGRSCYLYLKNTLNMPLPALSCVQRWASSV